MVRKYLLYFSVLCFAQSSSNLFEGKANETDDHRQLEVPETDEGRQSWLEETAQIHELPRKPGAFCPAIG